MYLKLPLSRSPLCAEPQWTLTLSQCLRYQSLTYSLPPLWPVPLPPLRIEHIVWQRDATTGSTQAQTHTHMTWTWNPFPIFVLLNSSVCSISAPHTKCAHPGVDLWPLHSLCHSSNHSTVHPSIRPQHNRLSLRGTGPFLIGLPWRGQNHGRNLIPCANQQAC